MAKAVVCRFYNWSLKEVKGMAYFEFLKFYKAANILQSREDLMQLKLSTYSNMKKNDQASFYKSLTDSAYPVNSSDFITTDQLMKELGNG